MQTDCGGKAGVRHQAAQVHHFARRCGCSVAARGACAAAHGTSGWLPHGGSAGPFAPFLAAFRQGLRETGYVEGQNVAIEYRWAEGQVDRLPAFARELVRSQVAVICAGSPPAALAAKAATTTIPIVFTSGEDPIKLGLVASYNRPGGNVTGIALLVDVLGAKRLGLLRDIVPAATLIAVLLHPSWPTFETQLNDVQEAARAVGQQIHVLHANTEREIDAAFDKAKELRASAMMVGPSTFFIARRDQTVLQVVDRMPDQIGAAVIKRRLEEPQRVPAHGRDVQGRDRHRGVSRSALQSSRLSGWAIRSSSNF